MFSRPAVWALCAAFPLLLQSSGVFAESLQVAPAPAVEVATASEVLPLAEVLEHTYAHNPTLEAARAELRAVEEEVPQAYANFKPTVKAQGAVQSADIEGGSLGGDGATSKDISITLSQPVYRGGRSTAQLEAARAVIEAQRALLLRTEQDVLLQAATAYMDVLRDQKLVDLRQQNVDLTARQVEAAQSRFDVGDLAITDVKQAASRKARAQADLIAARGNLKSTHAVFERIVGYAPDKTLRQPLIDLGLPETLEQAQAEAQTRNPGILAALSTHKASESDVDNVFGELLPEVGFVALWDKTFDPQPGLTDKQTTKSVTLNATVPLYQAGEVRSRLRQTKETANRRYLETLEARDLARAQTVTAWEFLQAAEAEIEARNAQVEAAEVAQRGVHDEVLLGTRTVLDALDADQEFLDAQSSLVSAYRNDIVAQFQLAAVLGVLTPETLAFGSGKTSAPESHQDIVKQRILGSHVDSVGAE